LLFFLGSSLALLLYSLPSFPFLSSSKGFFLLVREV
jgi:hypothetical protein